MKKTDGTIGDKNAGWSIACDDEACDSGVYDSHYLVGNYYQWLAATAQTITEGQAITEPGAKVESSICAKGWELPTSGSYGTGAGQATGNSTYNNASGSYFNLITKTADNALVTTGTSNGNNAQMNNGYSPLDQEIATINGNKIVTENILTGQPMHFLRAGNVSPWSALRQVRNVGGRGLYRSSVTDSITRARYLGFREVNVSPSGSDYRALGFPVRCLINGGN